MKSWGRKEWKIERKSLRQVDQFKESWTAAKKEEKRKNRLMWQCPHLLVNDHLFGVSRQSDENGDDENSGAVYRSPVIFLTAMENPGKPQLADHLKAVRSVKQAILFR